MDNASAEEQTNSINTEKTSAAFYLTKQILEQIYHENPAQGESLESGQNSRGTDGKNQDIN